MQYTYFLILQRYFAAPNKSCDNFRSINMCSYENLNNRITSRRSPPTYWLSCDFLERIPARIVSTNVVDKNGYFFEELDIWALCIWLLLLPSSPISNFLRVLHQTHHASCGMQLLTRLNAL